MQPVPTFPVSPVQITSSGDRRPLCRLVASHSVRLYVPFTVGGRHQRRITLRPLVNRHALTHIHTADTHTHTHMHIRRAHTRTLTRGPPGVLFIDSSRCVFIDSFVSQFTAGRACLWCYRSPGAEVLFALRVRAPALAHTNWRPKRETRTRIGGSGEDVVRPWFLPKSDVFSVSSGPGKSGDSSINCMLLEKNV